MAGALDGIKVLDFTQVYSGSFCTLLLRDLGAEIIKVERREGDVVRNDAPLTQGLESGTFIILNRGKKSITVDMKSEKVMMKFTVSMKVIMLFAFTYGGIIGLTMPLIALL